MAAIVDRVSAAVTVSVMCFSVTAAAGGSERTWRAVDEKDGIKVFSRQAADSDIIAFRGEGLVQAPIGTLVSLFFSNPEQAPEWVDMLTELRVLESTGPYSKVYRARYRQPWPVTDRDFVYQSRGQIDATDKTFTITYRSVADPRGPADDCCVRGEIMETYFKFTSQDANSTWVECEVSLDPKGWLPTWVVNLVQEGWPYNTISGIRRHVSRIPLVADARFATWW